MATFNYSTITAEQALAITAADTLVIDQGPANATTVLFVQGVGAAPDTIHLVIGATTVAFATAIAGATITYADGSRLYIGTSAPDAPAVFPASNDGMYGSLGNDTLQGGPGINQMQGNQGADSLVGGVDRDVIYGGQDNDTIRTGQTDSAGVQNFAQGNRGDDIIMGSPTASDILLGGQGNDIIGASGAGPVQFLVPGYAFYLSPVGFTGGGADFIIGNLGNDIIFGGGGNDNLSGEDGDDFISDIGGANTVNGGTGNDVVVVFGESFIDTGAGNDVVAFAGGSTVTVLGEGDDIAGILQTTAADRLAIDGRGGNDAITASDGMDTIVGGPGNDTIDGRAGGDAILGGDGADVFQYFGARDPATLETLDSIFDWGSSDKLAYFEAGGRALGSATSANYVEATYPDYAAALAFANAQIAGGTVNYVAAQIGNDVYVFADSANNNGAADTALRLVGRSLTDIAAVNIGSG